MTGCWKGSSRLAMDSCNWIKNQLVATLESFPSIAWSIWLLNTAAIGTRWLSAPYITPFRPANALTLLIKVSWVHPFVHTFLWLLHYCNIYSGARSHCVRHTGPFGSNYLATESFWASEVHYNGGFSSVQLQKQRFFRLFEVILNSKSYVSFLVKNFNIESTCHKEILDKWWIWFLFFANSSMQSWQWKKSKSWDHRIQVLKMYNFISLQYSLSDMFDCSGQSQRTLL